MTVKDGIASACGDFGAYHMFTLPVPKWECSLGHWDCPPWWTGCPGEWAGCCVWTPPACLPDETQTVYYAVIPVECALESYPSNPLDGISALATHEIIEGATDPVVPTGWIDWNTFGMNEDLVKEGELSDICSLIRAVPTNPVRMSNGLLVRRLV